VCAGCALAAASAATGFRNWLQNSGLRFLTPRRLRALTITAMAVAAIVSSVGFSGSTAPAHTATATAHSGSR
jgi:hypothetical protein